MAVTAGDADADADGVGLAVGVGVGDALGLGDGETTGAGRPLKGSDGGGWVSAFTNAATTRPTVTRPASARA